MTTTRRPTRRGWRPGPRTLPDPTPVADDLAALSARWSAVIGDGGDPGAIAAAIVGYRRAKTIVDGLRTDARRRQLAVAAETVLASGATMTDRVKIVRRSRPDRPTLALRSEAVRRASPELWAASRVRSVRLAISGEVTVPPPPSLRASVDTLAAAIEQSRRAIDVNEARQREARAVLVGAFDRLAEVGVWSGEAIVTADGWRVGYSAGLAFNAARCGDLARSFGVDADALREPTVIAGSIWYAVEPITVADLADLDEAAT